MYKGMKIFLTCAFILTFAYIALGVGSTTMLSLDKYECTVTKIEFSTESSGNNWVTAAEGSQITNPTIDIAAVGFGEKAGSMMQGISLREGTYVRCRLTLSPTFVIKGTVHYGLNIYYTKSSDPSLPAAPAQESTVENLDDEMKPKSYVQIVSGNVKVTKGQTTTVKIEMSTDDCLGMMDYPGGGYLIIPKEPSWTFTEG